MGKMGRWPVVVVEGSRGYMGCGQLMTVGDRREGQEVGESLWEQKSAIN